MRDSSKYRSNLFGKKRVSNSKKRFENLRLPHISIATLSNTTKMPGPSFGLPAPDSCSFSVFGDGSICGGCYANNGAYILFKPVKVAQHARFAWAVDATRSKARGLQFVRHMCRAIRASGCTYFRIHDSGDFFNAEYTRLWYRICKNLPNIRFWAPVRGWQSRNPWRQELVELAKLPNVSVRPSALFYNAPPPRILGLDAGSMVFTERSSVPEGTFFCPAYEQDGECRECRHCWDSRDVPVAYIRHGKGARKQKTKETEQKEEVLVP